jgi:hypothetical protein
LRQSAIEVHRDQRKNTRQSFDAFTDRKAAYVLSAPRPSITRSSSLTSVLDEKTNEITAEQALTAAIALPKKVRNRPRDGNALIVQLKNNQPDLLCCLEPVAAATSPIEVDDSSNLADACLSE